jgi:hypothetical protein
LIEEDIATIERWVAAGIPQGDPVRRPALPAFTEGRIRAYVRGVSRPPSSARTSSRASAVVLPRRRPDLRVGPASRVSPALFP